MPPLETDPVVEGGQRRRMDYHVMLELQHLCAAIKRLMWEHLEDCMRAGRLPAMLLPQGPPNAPNGAAALGPAAPQGPPERPTQRGEGAGEESE